MGQTPWLGCPARSCWLIRVEGAAGLRCRSGSSNHRVGDCDIPNRRVGVAGGVADDDCARRRYHRRENLTAHAGATADSGDDRERAPT